MKSLLIAAVISSAVTLAGSAEPLPAEAAVQAAVGKGDLDEAIAALRSASDALERESRTDPSGAAQRLDELAMTVAGFGAPGIAAARAAAERGRGWRERAFGANDPEVAKSWSVLTDIAFIAGDWSSAEASVRKALAIRRSADSLETLAVVLIKEGRLADAEPLMTEAVAMRHAAAPADPAKLADALNVAAELHRMRDRLDDAARTFDEAIALAAPLAESDPLLVARLETNRAGLAKDRGRLGDAEEGVRRSLALKEKAAAKGLPADLSLAWLNLAEIYRLEANHEAAEPLYRKALEVARQELGPDHPELAIHISQLAVLERDTGRLEDAERLFGEAAAQFERTLGPDHPMLAQTLNDLAEVEIARGRYAEAIAQAERALAIRRKALGADNSETAASLVTLARAETARHDEGDAARARAHVDEALTILRRTGNYPETTIDALSVRAHLDPRGRDLEDAVALVETLRPEIGGGEATRAAFLGKYTDLYARLVAVEASRGRVAEAFAVAERGRGRALLDLLAAAGVDLLSGIPEPRRGALRAREAAARADVAEWQARAASIRERTDLEDAVRRDELSAAERELTRASTAFRLVHEEIKNASSVWRGASGGAPIDLAAARRDVLAKGEVLLHYSIGPEESWLLFVLPEPAEPKALRLVVGDGEAKALGIDAGPLTAASLDDALFGISGAVAAISSPPTAGAARSNGSLAALFRVLVPEAARDAISHADGALIVPDASLFRLPFEALVVGEGRYWLDALPPARYAVSATVLREIAHRPASTTPRRTPDTLSVANPAYDRGGPSRWKALPGTAREAEALAGVRGITLLAGAAADEPHVRAAIGGRRYLHLATHGVVDRGRGELFAALVLAPPAGKVVSTEDDGYLRLYEIYESDVACDLAVLSACSSGTGTGVPGEGSFALTRGFQAAGARRTIGTLWPVEDEASARLVAELFRKIGTGEPKGGYARALRDAKRLVRKDPKTAAPFYWAPFVFSGLR